MSNSFPLSYKCVTKEEIGNDLSPNMCYQNNFKCCTATRNCLTQCCKASVPDFVCSVGKLGSYARTQLCCIC